MMQPEEDDDGNEKTAKDQLSEYHGAQCWVAGWGHTFYSGQSSNVARSVGLNLLDHDYCVKHRKCSISFCTIERIIRVSMHCGPLSVEFALK